MNLFIAKFDQLDSTRSPQDLNGNYPLIADVLSGEANSIIINGTLFNRDNLTTQMIYLCKNYIDIVGRDQIKVLMPVSLLELKKMIQELGEPIYSLSKEDEEVRMYQGDCENVGDDSLEWDRKQL